MALEKEAYTMDLLACSHNYTEEHKAGRDAASQKRALVDAVRVNMQKEIGANGTPGFSAETVLDAANFLYENWNAPEGGIEAFSMLLDGQTSL